MWTKWVIYLDHAFPLPRPKGLGKGKAWSWPANYHLTGYVFKLDRITKLKDGNFITIIPYIHPIYKVSFSFKATTFRSGWHNIMQMTAGGNAYCKILFHVYLKHFEISQFQIFFWKLSTWNLNILFSKRIHFTTLNTHILYSDMKLNTYVT